MSMWKWKEVQKVLWEKVELLILFKFEENLYKIHDEDNFMLKGDR